MGVFDRHRKKPPTDVEKQLDEVARKLQALLIEYNCEIVPIIVLGPGGVVEAGTKLVLKGQS